MSKSPITGWEDQTRVMAPRNPAPYGPPGSFPASFRFTWREVVEILMAFNRAETAIARVERNVAQILADLSDARATIAEAQEELRCAKNRCKNADAYLNNAKVHLGTGNFNEALLAVVAARERLVEPPPEES